MSARSRPLGAAVRPLPIHPRARRFRAKPGTSSVAPVLTLEPGRPLRGVVDAVGGREAIVAGDVRLTFAELDERANRLAHVLAVRRGRPRRPRRPRPAQRARVPRGHAGRVQAPGRAVQRQLPLHRRRAGATCSTTPTRGSIIHEPDLGGPRRRRGLEPSVRATVCPDPRRGLRGALAAGQPRRPDVARSGDDRYLLYTGGTTGIPKGVVWRHEDLFFAPSAAGNPGGDPVDRPRGGRRACAPRAAPAASRRRRSSTAPPTGRPWPPCSAAVPSSSTPTRLRCRPPVGPGRGRARPPSW